MMLRLRFRWWLWWLLVTVVVVEVVVAAQDDDEEQTEEPQPEEMEKQQQREQTQTTTTSYPAVRCQCDVSTSTFNCSRLDLQHTLALEDLWTRLSLPCTAQTPILVLDVSHNKLDSLDDLDLNHTDTWWRGQVQVLNVSFNAIQTFRALRHMTELRELFVSNNRLETLLLPEDECKLETLDAAHNVLTQLPHGLEACSSLSYVNASHNLIEDLPLDLLKLLLDTERKSDHLLTVDLRDNPLTEGSVRDVMDSALGCLQVTPDAATAADCACATITRTEGNVTNVTFTLRLCVSDMCLDGKERWSDITNTTTAEDHCRDPPTAHQVVTITTDTSIAEEEETSTPPVKTQTQPPPPPQRPVEGEGKNMNESTPSAEPPPPPLTSQAATERRRRRRVALALILTAVALVLGSGLGAALVVLYRRRRRAVRREEAAAAARLALKPLLSNTTPRFMRPTDDRDHFQS